MRQGGRERRGDKRACCVSVSVSECVCARVSVNVLGVEGRGEVKRPWRECGTTSMYGDIMKHLNLKPAWRTNTHHSQKEVHFFDQDENQAAIVGQGELTGWNNHLEKHNAACSSTGFELDEEMQK